MSVNSVISSGLDNEIDFLSKKNSRTNNNIINYTGIPLKFKYNNKIYECDIDSETNIINYKYELTNILSNLTISSGISII